MPTYKPKSELRTRRSGAEASESEAPGWDNAATAIDRPLVDQHALEQARLKERVERERRGRAASDAQRKALIVLAVLIFGLALAAGAGLGAYLALSS